LINYASDAAAWSNFTWLIDGFLNGFIDA